jgi:hypothetical protein
MAGRRGFPAELRAFLAAVFPADAFAGDFAGLRRTIFVFSRRASLEFFALFRVEIRREAFRLADLEADTVADLPWNRMEWLE